VFPYPIARPQNCDIQTFYGGISTLQSFTWNKPIAASHVYMLLIGGGGAGDGTTGGASGVVTVWYGAAQNVPNSLVITPASAVNGTATTVNYRGSSLVTLLSARTANGATEPAANAITPFGSSGFYKSTDGQIGEVSANPAPSLKTFLSAGAGAGGTLTANYGYQISQNAQNDTNGYFLLQPIIVGIGGINAGKGGVGCGGSASSGTGSNGMVLIASW
jgi:hypothetical protein